MRIRTFFIAAASSLLLTGSAFADPADAPGLADRGGVAPASPNADPQGSISNDNAAPGSPAASKG